MITSSASLWSLHDGSSVRSGKSMATEIEKAKQRRIWMEIFASTAEFALEVSVVCDVTTGSGRARLHAKIGHAEISTPAGFARCQTSLTGSTRKRRTRTSVRLSERSREKATAAEASGSPSNLTIPSRATSPSSMSETRARPPLGGPVTSATMSKP